MTEDRRARGRYRIECPVVVHTQDFDAQMSVTKGKLVDIGSNGARVLVDESICAGSRVVIEIELPSSRRASNKVRFEGTVLRSQSQHEVAVTFPESGRFLQPDLGVTDPPDTESEEEQ